LGIEESQVYGLIEKLVGIFITYITDTERQPDVRLKSSVTAHLGPKGPNWTLKDSDRLRFFHPFSCCHNIERPTVGQLKFSSQIHQTLKSGLPLQPSRESVNSRRRLQAHDSF
jgi:hypothetical protein